MSRSYKVYLNDLLNSIQKIEQFVEDIDFERFSSDNLKVDATLYNLFIIGEAIKHIPDEIRAKYTDVEWRRAAGLRDIIAHEYFRVELEIIWNIVQEERPELRKQVEVILENEQP